MSGAESMLASSSSPGPRKAAGFIPDVLLLATPLSLSTPSPVSAVLPKGAALCRI